MQRRFIILLLFSGVVLSAAEFQDYQAARAVIGQASFSAHDKGITARSLSLSNGNLYAADHSGHVLSYDLSRLGSAKNNGCPVCLIAPQLTVAQSVFPGVAAVAVNGRRTVIAAEKSHRVMLWSGLSPLQQPDVVLSNFIDPVAVALDNKRLFVADIAAHHVFIWNSWPASNSQPPDITLGASEANAMPGADTLQTPAALASDGLNLYVADSAAHRILVFSPGDSVAPTVVNAATLVPGPLAPGTLVLIDHAPPNATVLVNGTPLKVAEVVADQFQVQIPYELNNVSSASLWTKTELEDGSSRISVAAPLYFAPTSPGIFAFGLKEPRTGLLLHSAAGIPLSPEDPAKPTELLTVWATGLGAVNSQSNADGEFDVLNPVRATINGEPVEVVSAVLPADAKSIYEVQLRCPAHLSGASILVLLQNDTKSNAVTFPVESLLP